MSVSKSKTRTRTRRLRVALSLAIGTLLCLAFLHTGNGNGGQNTHPKGTSDVINTATTTTSTTTTPTPFFLLAKSQNSNITIEKYDALKVHAQIMKAKLSKINYKMKETSLRAKKHLSSSDLHLFYDDYLKLHANSTNSNETVLSNLQLASAAGAGVLVVKCSRLSPAHRPTHALFKALFSMAPTYKLKIALGIKEYMKRNVMSVRKDIRIFLSTYGNEKALYQASGLDGVARPVVYVMDSFSISANEWAEILAPNRQSTIRGTLIDCIVLGQLQHEEHGSHVRRSQFDGFFTGCYPNGETFGSTWKNWQSISIWADTHSLVWSAGISEGDGGSRAIGAALRTTLRSRPKPTFISLCKLSFSEDYMNEVQSWLSSRSEKVSQ